MGKNSQGITIDSFYTVSFAQMQNDELHRQYVNNVLEELGVDLSKPAATITAKMNGASNSVGFYNSLKHLSRILYSLSYFSHLGATAKANKIQDVLNILLDSHPDSMTCLDHANYYMACAYMTIYSLKKLNCGVEDRHYQTIRSIRNTALHVNSKNIKITREILLVSMELQGHRTNYASKQHKYCMVNTNFYKAIQFNKIHGEAVASFYDKIIRFLRTYNKDCNQALSLILESENASRICNAIYYTAKLANHHEAMDWIKRSVAQFLNVDFIDHNTHADEFIGRCYQRAATAMDSSYSNGEHAHNIAEPSLRKIAMERNAEYTVAQRLRNSTLGKGCAMDTFEEDATVRTLTK